jgi:hypothetical protein
VAGVGAEGRPTRGINGDRRRLPRWLGGNGEEGVLLGNTQTWGVYWGLVKLLERLAGGERERGCELTAAAAMAGGAAGMASGGEKGRLL